MKVTSSFYVESQRIQDFLKDFYEILHECSCFIEFIKQVEEKEKKNARLGEHITSFTQQNEHVTPPLEGKGDILLLVWKLSASALGPV